MLDCMKQRERKKRMKRKPARSYTLFELTVSEATLDLSGQEVVELFQMLLTRVRA